MPLVSVVVPIYNGERFLEEALDSIFSQTFTKYEVLCIDDGSTDGSLAILQQYGARVTVLRQANQGQGAARNVGARRAHGDYLAFLDQDDRWYPQKLEQQVTVLKSDPDVALVYCNSDRMDAEGRILERGATLRERASALTSPLGLVVGEGLVLPSAMMVHRTAFEQVGGFDDQLRGFEDFDLCARLRLHGRFVFLEQSGLVYRLHRGGFSRSGGVGVIRSRERFLHRMRGLFVDDQAKVAFIDDMLADCYSDWGMHEVRSGMKSEGREKLLRSLRFNPAKLRTYSRWLRSFLPFARTATKI